MRLELASYDVRDIRFSASTRLADGILYVDREALRALVLESGDFADVAVEIVRPGESVRLIHVIDAAEPRFKTGDGSSFPAFAGPLKTVGSGRTHRLRGMAILCAGGAVAGEPTYWRESIVEMSGPAARATPFGATVNLVLEFTPGAQYLDAAGEDAVAHNLMVGSELSQRYHRAVRVAELKLAVNLARLTASMEPDSVEVFDSSVTDPALPKVVYFFQVGGMHAYGENVEKGHGTFPLLLHPNEVLDGALVSTLSNVNSYHKYPTFLLQNHAVVRELHARHGVDVNFAGVIAYPRGANDVIQKHMIADQAVKIAQQLGAQGACSSYWGSGHSCVEFMYICQKCERAGIKVVQMLPEGMDSAEGPGVVYFVPEAVAVISTGRIGQGLQLPAVERVIGGTEMFPFPGAPEAEREITYRHLYACAAASGHGRLTTKEY
ncbi:MAG: hypothetical protein IT529_12195 [Burkholderiales bacterium]|nr:hypothetical protein [Burkholderiales bacterium]